jgi:hypothetical protein
MTSLLKIRVLYCALIDLAYVADGAGQMQACISSWPRRLGGLSEPIHTPACRIDQISLECQYYFARPPISR